jgi:hypothetical protein
MSFVVARRVTTSMMMSTRCIISSTMSTSASTPPVKNSTTTTTTTATTTTTSTISTAYPCPPTSTDLADLLKLQERFPRQIEELNTNVSVEKKKKKKKKTKSHKKLFTVAISSCCSSIRNIFGDISPCNSSESSRHSIASGHGVAVARVRSLGARVRIAAVLWHNS